MAEAPPEARRLKRPRGHIRTRSCPGLFSGAYPDPLLTDSSDDDADVPVDNDAALRGPRIRRTTSMPCVRQSFGWRWRLLLRWSWTRAGENDRFYDGR
jgi:hypothetical protein